VNDGWAGFVILLLADPHVLEGRQRSQDGASNPDRVLPLRGSDDLDLHGGRSLSDHLLVHSVGDARVHGGASGHDGVGIQILSDVDIALHDGVVGDLVDTLLLHTQERGLEEGFRAPESLISDGDDLTVGKLVLLLEGGVLSGVGHLVVKVEGDIAELLFDVPDDFTLGGGGEAVSSFSEDLHQVVGQVPAGEVEPHDGVGQTVSLIDGDGMGDTVTAVHDDTGGPTRSVQGEDGLDSDVHGWGVEGFEHDLGHLLSVGLGVEGGLGQEDGVLLGSDPELVEEGVVPDLFHIIPRGDDTVLDGVFQGQDTSLGLGFVTDVGVLGAHADHDTLVTGTSD